MWCAVTGARHFLQHTWGKATEDKSAHTMIYVNSAAVIALVLLMNMICVFRPNQPQSAEKKNWLNMTCTVIVQCKWFCVVNHNNGSNNNDNHDDNRNQE